MTHPTHSQTDTIRCPHCHQLHTDLWEYPWDTEEAVEVECGTCDRTYTLTRSVRITYTATPTHPHRPDTP